MNIQTAVKRGIYTIHGRLVLKIIGTLTTTDAGRLEQSLKIWWASLKGKNQAIAGDGEGDRGWVGRAIAGG